MSKSDAVTKQDIEDIKSLITDSIQEVLSAIGPEVQDIKATTARIENMLDATSNKVDDHEVRITKLEHQAV